jgi:hypothetical protein
MIAVEAIQTAENGLSRRSFMIPWVASKRVFSILVTIVAFALNLFISLPLNAQVVGATLTGTVTDSTGAIIPGAKVSIKNAETGLTRELAADSDGLYSAPNLLPGSFEITVSAAGFGTQVRSGITLTVGQRQVLDFTMQVGQTSQTVEVTGEAPTVELQSSSIGGLVNSETVVELPLNGRDWTTLAALEPGVIVVPTQFQISSSSVLANRGYGNQMSVSGTRPQMNNYRLDGVSIVDSVGGAPGSVLGVSLGVDSIEEFSVVTSNSSAEYGRTSGGGNQRYYAVRDESNPWGRLLVHS